MNMDSNASNNKMQMNKPMQKPLTFDSKISSPINHTTPETIMPPRSVPVTSTTALETVEQLKQTVRDWVKLDNEVRVLNKEITTRRNEKKDISKRLIEVMRDNKLDIFELKDGQLMYVKKNKKKPITQKQLLTLLSTYYKEDVSKAEEMHSYLMDNREEVVEETIQRKITNS